MKSKHANVAASELVRMNTIARLILAASAFTAALCFDVPPSRASGDAPWCAVLNMGGDVYWDCQYRSVEECVPNVLSGSRGFCNANPWYKSETIGNQKHRKRHEH